MLGRKLKTAVNCLKTGELGSVAQFKFNEFVMLCYPVLPPAVYMSLRMQLQLGYWPNIRRPRSFNEKIVHRQLFAQHPLASLVADKWRVREYVAERGLGNILNEVYFITNDPERIPFDDLPNRFVIKANHGSGWNILVKDKRTADRQEVVRQCREWLGLTYSKATRSYETHVDSVVPVILVEKFIEDGERDLPLDYKLYCFHGRAHYVGVVERTTSPTVTFYDRAWQPAEFSKTLPKGERMPKPGRFDQMVDIAESLAAGFDFARVDLYAPDSERVLFGEVTMSPVGGLGRFTPRKWDFRLGGLW